VATRQRVAAAVVRHPDLGGGDVFVQAENRDEFLQEF
jgi:hypothetical protein